VARKLERHLRVQFTAHRPFHLLFDGCWKGKGSGLTWTDFLGTCFSFVVSYSDGRSVETRANVVDHVENVEEGGCCEVAAPVACCWHAAGWVVGVVKSQTPRSTRSTAGRKPILTEYVASPNSLGRELLHTVAAAITCSGSSARACAHCVIRCRNLPFSKFRPHQSGQTRTSTATASICKHKQRNQTRLNLVWYISSFSFTGSVSKMNLLHTRKSEKHARPNLIKSTAIQPEWQEFM